jgi:hypothetical protein
MVADTSKLADPAHGGVLCTLLIWGGNGIVGISNLKSIDSARAVAGKIARARIKIAAENKKQMNRGKFIFGDTNGF